MYSRAMCTCGRRGAVVGGGQGRGGGGGGGRGGGGARRLPPAHGGLAEEGAVEGDDRGVRALVERLELEEDRPARGLVGLDGDHLCGARRVRGAGSGAERRARCTP